MQPAPPRTGTGDEGGTTSLERATQRLRELLLAGAFPLGAKVAEAAVAGRLGVSRTPARLAMAALEQEGLLARLPRRGFRVRGFSVEEVVEAVEVRGELEGMAARLAAERGLSDGDRAALEACLDQAERLLAKPALTAADRILWCQMNLDFHGALVRAAGSRALAAAHEQVSRVPLASARDIFFNQTSPALARFQLMAAQDDHRRAVAALLARRGTEAAELMREHARRSGENKRRSLAEMPAQPTGMEGAALVRPRPPEDRARKGRTRRPAGATVQTAPAASASDAP